MLTNSTREALKVNILELLRGIKSTREEYRLYYSIQLREELGLTPEEIEKRLHYYEVGTEGTISRYTGLYMYLDGEAERFGIIPECYKHLKTAQDVEEELITIRLKDLTKYRDATPKRGGLYI